MRNVNKNTLLFVPLVGKTSACRQKEGLELIKNLPRLTAVLPQSGKDAMKSPSFGTTCHFPHKGGRSTGSTRYLTQGRESNGCFTSSQNVGRVLPDNQENLIENSSCVVGPAQKLLRTSALLNKLSGRALTYNGVFPSPLVGEGGRRPGEGFLRGFTLIELLVVVLIIGILAAVALPQYQRAVEKARMTEAVINVRAIANAHQLYYLAHGEYLSSNDMDKLDISIPGGILFGRRIASRDFYYSPNGEVSTDYLALAWHFKMGNNHTVDLYKVYITQDEPGKIKCGSVAAASDIQKKLCEQLNSKGTL